jgi:hypothetical protein
MPSKQELFISWELSKSLIETYKAMQQSKGFDQARFTTSLCGVYTLERRDDGLLITREVEDANDIQSDEPA